MIKRLIHRLGRAYVQRIVESDAAAQEFDGHNERPAEYSFVFRQINTHAPESVLDVGTGQTALPALIRHCGCVVTAIDNVRDYWPTGMINRHWHVINEDITKTSRTATYDMITCISVLEHIKGDQSAMLAMLRLLRPGGHLVLTCPYTDGEYVEDTYRAPGADPRALKQPFICRSYSRTQLNGWLNGSLRAELIEAEYWRAFTGRHWMMGERVAPPKPSSLTDEHSLGCFLIRRI